MKVVKKLMYIAGTALATATVTFPTTGDDQVTAYEAAPFKLAGSGMRHSTQANTVAGNNYKAIDFAVGMPDVAVEEVAFFFPTFYCTSTGEVDCGNGYTIEGMSTRGDDDLRTRGSIDGGMSPVEIDPSQAATPYGKWVIFRPASPIPAGAVQRFSASFFCPDGQTPNPRLLAGNNNLINMFGDLMPFERYLSSDTSLLSTLSDSTAYTNADGPPPPIPTMMMCRGVQNSFAGFGDSIDYGSQATRSARFFTNRMAIGSLEIGLVESKRGRRLAGNLMAIPGWNITTTDTDKSHANTQASMRQIWALQKAVELNGGAPIADMIWCGHGQNSSTGSYENLVAGVRAFKDIWPAILGDANMPIYWTGMRATVASSDGFQTVANQFPDGSQASFPGGSRWLFNDALEPGGELRADGTVTDAVQLYPVSSLPDPDRDLFRVLDFNTTVTTAYNGTGNVEMAEQPEVGMWLNFVDPSDGTTVLGQGPVFEFSGDGPYSVNVNIPGSPTFPVGTIVQEGWDDGGVHVAPIRHIDYAEPVIDLKIALGFVKPVSAPSFISAGITGTPSNTEVISASVEFDGNPEPTVSYQWLDSNLDPISGEDGQNYTVNAARDGWSVGSEIPCDITLTSDQGSVTQRVTIEYVDASSLFLTVSDAPTWLQDTAPVGAGVTKIRAEARLTFPASGWSSARIFTLSSTGFDLSVLPDGEIFARVEDGTTAPVLDQSLGQGLFVAVNETLFVWEVDQVAQTSTLTINGGTPIVTAFTAASNGSFQSSRTLTFLGLLNSGSQGVPNGTIVKDLAFYLNDALHKQVSNVVADANADEWHQGGDFT